LAASKRSVFQSSLTALERAKEIEMKGSFFTRSLAVLITLALVGAASNRAQAQNPTWEALNGAFDNLTVPNGSGLLPPPPVLELPPANVDWFGPYNTPGPFEGLPMEDVPKLEPLYQVPSYPYQNQSSFAPPVLPIDGAPRVTGGQVIRTMPVPAPRVTRLAPLRPQYVPRGRPAVVYPPVARPRHTGRQIDLRGILNTVGGAVERGRARW
jgi:hypothetical protein